MGSTSSDLAKIPNAEDLMRETGCKLRFICLLFIKRLTDPGKPVYSISYVSQSLYPLLTVNHTVFNKYL